MLGSTVPRVAPVRWVLPFVFLASAGAIAMWHASESRGAVGGGGSRARQKEIDDPASILADRSPGARDPGTLFQTKPVANMAMADEPNAPATNLLEPFPLPPIDTMPRAFTAIAPPPDEGPVNTGPAPIVQPVGASTGSAPAGPLAVFPQVPLPLFGPPVVQQIGPNPPGTDIPVGSIPAAPEPASWATMLIGFLGLGSLLRRARRKRRGDIPA